MKIAIIGTRGIPHNYGGFEQFAEQISVRMAKEGHEVTVYNPSFHPYKEKTYKNVNIVSLTCRENVLGGAAHFFYDFHCYKHAIKTKSDIILNCGYGTSAPALAIINKGQTRVVTNMDGFEWKRGKYNFITKKFLKWFEKIALTCSHRIVADHPIVQEYYKEKYKTEPALISYGAEIMDHFDEAILSNFGLERKKYFIVVARDEPENQIEFIISSWKYSNKANKLCVVTNHQRLSEKYKNENGLIFIHGLYDSLTLASLRHFSLACIHGHTVGGTNPSLLEAMAAQSFIIAHDNVFHRNILKDNTSYFNSDQSLTSILDDFKLTEHNSKFEKAITNNLIKIKESYSWEKITEDYLKLFDNL